MHKTVLISFFEIRTVCLRGHGAAKNGLQMHNTRLNVSAVQIHILSIWPCTCNTRVCNEFDMLLCPAVKAFSFINAIGHPLSLDARPHKATLVALSLRHCHLCVCIPSYLHERKKRFMWHTCAPRGSDRKRASVRRPPPLLPPMGTRNLWQTVSPALATALIKALMIGFQLRSNLSSHIIAQR